MVLNATTRFDVCILVFSAAGALSPLKTPKNFGCCSGRTDSDNTVVAHGRFSRFRMASTVSASLYRAISTPMIISGLAAAAIA